MQSLKITAVMASPIGVFDDHSPSLDGLIEWLLLENAGDRPRRDLANAQMPLGKGYINGEWYWQTSGPVYYYYSEEESRYRKRWQPGVDSPRPEWGRRKAKWNTSAGSEKSYDLPIYLRLVNRIDWYCNGDEWRIRRLLAGCTALGKKRSQGYGQVTRWEVVETPEDWHLYRGGSLMRPIPVEYVDRPCRFTVRMWGWRPPSWDPKNSRRCAMPVDTVQLVTGGFSYA